MDLPINKIIFGLIGLELAVVAYQDIRTKKISNHWSLLNLGLAVVLYSTLRLIYPFDLEVFLFPLLTVFIGFFLYLVDIMGAGDSKFLASLFFIMPPENHVIYFESLVTATLVMGALMLSWKMISAHRELKAHFLLRNWKEFFRALRSEFSYAPVMLLAWGVLGMKLWL